MATELSSFAELKKVAPTAGPGTQIAAAVREKEIDAIRLRPHPHEFELYYDC